MISGKAQGKTAGKSRTQLWLTAGLCLGLVACSNAGTQFTEKGGSGQASLRRASDVGSMDAQAATSPSSVDVIVDDNLDVGDDAGANEATSGSTGSDGMTGGGNGGYAGGSTGGSSGGMTGGSTGGSSGGSNGGYAGGGSTGGSSGGMTGGSTGGSSGGMTGGSTGGNSSGGSTGGSTGGSSSGGSTGGGYADGGSSGGSTGGSTGGGYADGGSTGGSNGGSTPGQTGGGTTNPPPAIEAPSASEVAACAKSLNLPASAIKVAGNQNMSQIKVESDKALAIKVTGNKNRVQLRLTGVEGKKMAGLCVFMAGNRTRLDVSVETDVDAIVHKARGNKTDTTIVVHEGFSVQHLSTDVKGNGSTISVTGDGSYPSL